MVTSRDREFEWIEAKEEVVSAIEGGGRLDEEAAGDKAGRSIMVKAAIGVSACDVGRGTGRGRGF